MDGARVSKSLIQISVDRWGCVPSLLFGLRPNYGRGITIMVTSFKRNCACTVLFSALEPESRPLPPSKGLVHTLFYSVPLTLQQATVDPRLGQKFLEVHMQVWLCLLSVYCSFILVPVTHKVLFVPSKSLFLQCCGSSIININLNWPPSLNSLRILCPFAGSPCCGF